MPELPDITVYVERLDALVKGETLERVRLLADRSLSRLLKKDWPRTVDELE